MRPLPVAVPCFMPETRPESCSRLANTAKRPSCAVSARSRDHAVALDMLVPCADQDLPPRSPLAGGSYHALLDRDAAVGELRSPYGWPAPDDPHGTCDYEGAGASRSPSGCATRSKGCATAHAGWSSLTSASTRHSPTCHPKPCSVLVDVRCVRRVLPRIDADSTNSSAPGARNPRVPEANAGRIAVGYCSGSTRKATLRSSWANGP